MMVIKMNAQTQTQATFQVFSSAEGMAEYFNKQREIDKIEFYEAFDKWAKARGAQEIQSLRNISQLICKKTNRVVEKDYYGHNVALEIFEPFTDEIPGTGIRVPTIVAILKVTWNKKEMWMAIQKSQLKKDHTHDYKNDYYEVNTLEHIGLALQIELSFNNAWFQFWRTMWFSGKIKGVDVKKIYRILD